jgi:hypothetical protein
MENTGTLTMPQMASSRPLVIAALAAMGAGYLVLPIYLGLSEDATDILAAALLPLALCIWTFEDHRKGRSWAHLLWVLLVAFLILFSVGASMLLGGVRFGVLIPVNALFVGFLYWFIDRHVPAGSD